MKGVLQRLEASVAQADNRAEGYRLIADAAQRLPQPDLDKAVAAANKIRDIAEASEAEQEAAKMLAGELLLKMGKPAEARKALDKIGKRAPAGLAVRARLLSARSLQDEHKWGEAATLYQAALADSHAPVPEALKGRAYFDLGLCYRRREQPADAAREWQKCVERGKDTPEGQAAALLLSEVLFEAPPAEVAAAGEKVAGLLTGAVAKVRQPADWNNPLLELARAREVLERGTQALRQAGRFDLALQVAPALEGLAGPLPALVLRGELSAAWAQARREAARGAAHPKQAEEAEEAKRLARQAAAAYDEAARAEGAAPEDVRKYLWASGLNYPECGEHAKAAEKLEAFIQSDEKSPQLSEAYYRLGEAHRQSGKAEPAGRAYRNAIVHGSASGSRFGYLALYQEALALMAAGNLDQAEEALKGNLKNMATLGPDPEAQEKSLLALGALCYQRRDYRGAVRPLEEVLHLFGKGPGALRARYQLADCYQQIAAGENLNVLLKVYKSDDARRHYEQEHRRWQLKAAEEFSSLSKLLEAPEGKGQLTDDQRVLVPFGAARCWFNAGEYEKALGLYESLIERHRGQAEELDALGGAIRCHAGLQEKHKGKPAAQEQGNLIRQRLLQISKALPAQKEPVRQVWTAWVEQASAVLQRAQPAPAGGGAPAPVRPGP
jgi:tetratricopeptide (TPR) repeat protein